MLGVGAALLGLGSGTGEGGGGVNHSISFKSALLLSFETL